ncbi:MAG: hypothetical protein R2780_06550 [Crocinitomicaceae bacterium]|nr:DUF4249 family protein [Crocinitomicaceae bacterium]
MKVLQKIYLSVIAITGLSLASCEDDFSLNGDYQVEPIVFGLLDHHDDFHTIKVTKAYLGDGDNLVYAKIPDSNYFSQVDAKIVEYKNESATGREWTLNDTIISNKDTTGIFYAPEQKVYGFYESTLDSSCSYKLTIDIEGGAYQVTGETALIDKFSVSGQILYPLFKVNFAPATINDTVDDYTPWNITVNEGKNAALYTYKYTFNYTEYYTSGGSASFSKTRYNGQEEQHGTADNPGVHIASFSGYDFYTWLRSVIPDDDNVDRRTFDGLDLRISVAHQEFYQYLQVGQPVTGIAQVQPEYTNLKGARGLFSSRLVYELFDFPLNGTSTKELCTGYYTGHLKFCSQLPEHASEWYYCP